MIGQRDPSAQYSNPCLHKKGFQPLNVSALLHNSLHDGRFCKEPPRSLQGEGFDNVAFDLEGLEKAQAGSRKPLVALHVRTVSAEEFVRSTLNNQSSHLRRSSEWPGPKYQPPVSFGDKGYNGPVDKYTDITGYNGKDKDILGYNDRDRDISGYSATTDWHKGKDASLSPSEGKGEGQSHVSRNHNNKNVKFPHLNGYNSPYLRNLRKENETKAKGNNDENYLNQKNQQTPVNNNKKGPLMWEGHSIYSRERESLPSNVVENEKKTDTLRAKKTGGGSTLELDEVTSLSNTMVQVGGVAPGISPPYTHNAVVSTPHKLVISSAGSGTTPTNVSQVSVMSGSTVRSTVAQKMSRVVLNHGSSASGKLFSAPTTSSTLAPSLVSALSKVSSVRIVPSPNTTPTPSVIGISASTSRSPTSTAEAVGQPAQSQPPPPPPPPSNSFVTSTLISNKSSHSCRSLEAVKRRIINNIRNCDQSSSSHPPPPPTTNTSSPQRRLNQQDSNLPLLESPSSGVRIVSAGTQQPETVLGTESSSREHQDQQPSPQTQPDPLRENEDTQERGGGGPQENTQGNGDQTQVPENVRREGRERRRERRERRRERRALRILGCPQAATGIHSQTELGPEPRPLPHHLPDLLNSHVPPPYSTLPNGPRSLGGLLGPPPPTVGAPPPISLQMPPPPPSGPPPMGPMGPYPLPAGPGHGGSVRPPLPENQWHFFGSRRSRSSRRVPSRLGGEEEAKSCCGLLVTQAVSIRWFIIMISFVGLCCTVVGTVLGAVKTNNSEYVTITLLMIGVGIVLITVSGVAWHLTSKDAPCRVMLGLAPNDSGRGETRRFMSRMAPTFGRPHHPYAAMMYPEFQYRPPPPSYQASMQEYRLRLFLLDRHGTQQFPPGTNTLPSPPPTYRPGPYNIRGLGGGTLSRESDYSRPPSYRSREGSVTHHPDAPPSVDPGGGGTPAHSRDPSCLSFLSHEGSTRLRGGDSHKSSPSGTTTKFPVVDSGSPQGDPSGGPAHTSKKGEKGSTSPSKDDNTVTIVQTTDCSHVIGSESVIVTVSGEELSYRSPPRDNGTEISVLAHL